MPAGLRDHSDRINDAHLPTDANANSDLDPSGNRLSTADGDRHIPAAASGRPHPGP
jgi:hypothetical protein